MVKKKVIKVEKIEDAIVFDHLVHPILDDKCISCHSKSKKKGGLSFQDSLPITKGGKSGATIVTGRSAESEMIKRVLLHPDHEDFMPPEGKTPLTEEEIAILKYWIDNANGNFNSTVSSVKETPETVLQIASSMLGLKGGSHATKGTINLPEVAVINESLLAEIKSEGFTLRELVFGSNLFEIVLPSYNKKPNDNLGSKLEKLSKIKDNIVWLYIEDNSLNDEHLKVISTFKNLQRLVISKNNITDKGISNIENLSHLTSLNVYGNSKISNISLNTFSKIKTLKNVYAWNTGISKKDIEPQKEDGPNIIIAP